MPDPNGEPFNADVKDWHPNESMMETEIKNLRFAEYAAVTDFSSNGLELLVAYSTKFQAQLEAAINIARTIFVTFVLAFTAIFFNSMTNKLVLLPIERMLEKVRAISKDPLKASEDDNAGIYAMMEEK